MTSNDQSQILDESLKRIKELSYYIDQYIEQSNLLSCICHTNTMLCELRKKNLIPNKYFILYTTIFDQMQKVEHFLKEQVKQNIPINNIYKLVQQSRFILPRIYLLITVGAVYIETTPSSCNKILLDLQSLIKGIQNPIRGLFIRYYLLKTLKDKFPDNTIEKDGSSIINSIKFILSNLEEMNILWKRMTIDDTSYSKFTLDKLRMDIKFLIGENITRLASLNGLTPEMYQKAVLPKILEIIFNSDDPLSQQYLFECLIQGFSDDYNLRCIELILKTLDALKNNIDLKWLLVSLMNKMTKYSIDYSSYYNESFAKISFLLKDTIDKLITDNSSIKSNTNLSNMLEISTAFMNFVVKLSPQNEKLNIVNHIIRSCIFLLKNANKKLTEKIKATIEKMLSFPLESELSVFDLTELPELLKYLNPSIKRSFSLKLIESITGGVSKEIIDSLDKTKKLLSFITPLLESKEEIKSKDDILFEYEQSIICKMLLKIKAKSPNEQLEIFIQFKNIFTNGGNKMQMFTLPSLCNALLIFCYQITSCFDNQRGFFPQNANIPIHKNFISSLDISFISSIETLETFQMKIYNLLNDIIVIIAKERPDIAIRFYLEAALHANSVQSNQNIFINPCASFINAAMEVYSSQKFEEDAKCKIFIEIICTLLRVKIIEQNFFTELLGRYKQMIMELTKRGNQCACYLAISEIYYKQLGEIDKVNECLQKAKNAADFSMANYQNVRLFLIILNKVLYYIELGENEGSFIKVDFVNQLIEAFQNHIMTIKTEVENTQFLVEVEQYYENTLSIIRKRKEVGKYKIYKEMNIQ